MYHPDGQRDHIRPSLSFQDWVQSLKSLDPWSLTFDLQFYRNLHQVTVTLAMSKALFRCTRSG